MSALIGSLALEALLTGFTASFPGAAGAYGAPLSVGNSCGLICLPFGSRSDTFLWPIFALNVVASGALLWLLMRLGGNALLVPLGALLFLMVAGVSYIRLPYGSPFAGLPFPIVEEYRLGRPFPRVELLPLWIDCMVGAALFALPTILRRRTRAATAG